MQFSLMTGRPSRELKSSCFLPYARIYGMSFPLTPTIHSSYHRNPVYGFKGAEELSAFESRVFILEQHVRCIPSTAEMRYHALKLPLVHMLDDLAKEQVTHSRRPATKPLPTRLLYRNLHNKYMVKRSHSSGGDHVHRISLGKPVPWDRSPGTFYFLQEYVDWLGTMGEARIGVVGGQKIIFRTWTGRLASNAKKDDGIWEFFELEASTSPPQSPHGTSSSASASANREPPAVNIIGRNLSALDSFVLATLSAAIAEEKGRFGSTSLEIFARVDVGVMPSEDGKSFSFFVNEIERMPGACFWTLGSEASNLPMPAPEVSQSLSAYIMRADRGILSRGVRAEWWAYKSAYKPAVASS